MLAQAVCNREGAINPARSVLTERSKWLTQSECNREKHKAHSISASQKVCEEKRTECSPCKHFIFRLFKKKSEEKKNIFHARDPCGPTCL